MTRRVDIGDVDGKLEEFFSREYHEFSKLYEGMIMQLDDMPEMDPGMSKLHSMLIGVLNIVLNNNQLTKSQLHAILADLHREYCQ